MDKLTVQAVIFDVGANRQSLKNTVSGLISQTRDLLAQGVDIVMYPEYCWTTISQYQGQPFSLAQLADQFWNDAWPMILDGLRDTKGMAVLGTVPARADTGLVNRCPILIDGAPVFQDKLALTPWENEINAGRELRILNYRGARIAVLVCLDIEMPEIALLLKKNGPVDLILVPSATESLMGVERIARCATARSVELGCAVITGALSGGIPGNPFIDRNTGRAALYMPSLKTTEGIIRVLESGVVDAGDHAVAMTVDLARLRESREAVDQTNPALVTPGEIKIIY